jgi:hypothetical protein
MKVAEDRSVIVLSISGFCYPSQLRTHSFRVSAYSTKTKVPNNAHGGERGNTVREVCTRQRLSNSTSNKVL